ncbi:helix-turn-helix domain-containing protein [Paludibacteraceae bacterium OttesenSCG-928-F17]|nr:helix-turn-helix domain-containing protein [Paludibacteraceae bacterium OttesenSCG-928-F17]
MATTKVTYELPPTLPQGWKKQVAKALDIHRNTVRNALVQGETHPLYAKIMETAKNKYGKPINQ